MDPFSIVAAATQGSGDFLVGILVGSCLGYLVGPALRSWQTYREWADASREARLTDRILTSLDADDPGAIEDGGVETDPAADTNGHLKRSVWRTSH